MRPDPEAWIEGEFVASETPAFALSDRLATHGVGLFETIGAWHGRLPLWDRHVARLSKSASAFGLRFEPGPELERAALELLRRNDREDGILRLTLGAAGEAGRQRSRCFLTTRPRILRDEPLRLVASRIRRGAGDRSAVFKTTSRAFYELAVRELEVPAGSDGVFDDVLILGGATDLLETAVGNVFLLKGGRLRTPEFDGRFLPGVGRQTILDAMAEDGCVVDECPVDFRDARDADRLWVTNAVYGPRRAELVRAAGESAAVVASTAEADEVEARLVTAWRRCLGLPGRVDGV